MKNIPLEQEEIDGIVDIINGTVDTIRGWGSDEEVALEVPYWERIIKKLKGE